MEVTKNIKVNLGINQSVDKTELQQGELVRAHNVDIGDGSITLKNGYTPFYMFSTNIKGLHKYYNGTKEILFVQYDNYIEKVNDDMSMSGIKLNTNEATYGDHFDTVNYQSGSQDVVLFANGNYIYSYRGAENKFQVLRGLGKDSDLYDSLNRAPKGRCIEIHKERLWVAGVDSNPNALYFSKDFDIEDFTTPLDIGEANQHGGIIMLPTFDGGKILGLRSMFNDLLVFKSKNILRVSGTSPDNFYIEQLFAQVNGEILDGTIRSVNNIALWCSTEGIFMFDGMNVKDLTPRVKNEWASLDKSKLSIANAIIVKDEYLLTIGNKTFVININTGVITTRMYMGNDITSMIEFSGELLFSCGSRNVYTTASPQFFQNGIIETGFDNYGYTAKKKKVNSVNFIASGDCTLRITAKTEDKEKYKDIVLTDTPREYRVKVRAKGHIIGYTIQNLGGTNFNISSIQTVVDVR